MMFKAERQDNLTSALKSMYIVIYAVILREIKVRNGNLKIGYLWALIEPMLFVAVLSIVFTLRRDDIVYGMPLLGFLLTGIIPFLLFRNTMSKTLQAVQGNKALLNFPQVHPFELVIAGAILEFVTLIIAFFILCLLMQNAGLLVIDIESYVVLALVLIQSSLFGFSIGVSLGSWMVLFPILKKISQPVIGRPMFFASGVFFTVEMLPPEVTKYLLLNPLFHLIEMFRSAFFVTFESKYTDPFYTVFIILFLLFLALLTQRALGKYVLET